MLLNLDLLSAVLGVHKAFPSSQLKCFTCDLVLRARTHARTHTNSTGEEDAAWICCYIQPSTFLQRADGFDWSSQDWNQKQTRLAGFNAKTQTVREMQQQPNTQQLTARNEGEGDAGQ